MKKKVLFALIALFSFLSSWAVGPQLTNVVGDNVWIIGSENLPGFTTAQEGDVITYFDINQTPLATPVQINTVGWYFAQLKHGDEVTILPFQAAQPIDYEIIKDAASFDASYGEGNGPGVLVPYYEKWPGEDLWNGTRVGGFNDQVYSFASFGDADGTNPYATGTIKTTWVSQTVAKATVLSNESANPLVSAETAESFKGQEFYITKSAEVGENIYPLYTNAGLTTSAGIYVQLTEGPTFPGFTHTWEGAINANGAKYPHVNVDCRNVQTNAGYRVALAYDGAVAFPWEETLFGNGEGQKAWGMESLPGAFPNAITAMPANETSNFDVSTFDVLLAPAQAEAPTWYYWTLSPTSKQYDAEDHYGNLVGSAQEVYVKVYPYGESSPAALEEGYEVKVYTTNTCTNETNVVKNVGSYFVKVFMEDRQLGASVLGDGIKEFKITAYTLTLGSSVAYKQIGDPDPDPEYSIIYDNAMGQEAANLTISGLKLVRQVDPVLGHVPTITEDYVGAQWKYYIDMNEAVISGVENAANNYRIGTSSVDGILVITKKLVNDEQFTVTIADEDLVYDGLEKKPAVTVTYNNPAAGIENKDVTAQFDVTYTNNINADAEGTNSGTEAAPVYAWINGENAATNAKVTVHPKADSDYTESIMQASVEVTGQITPKPFKIKQRDIYQASLAEIKPVIFKNAAWEPTPAASMTRNDNSVLNLTAGTDFTYSYNNNVYVSTEAEVIIEATYTEAEPVAPATEGEHIYTGNWFGVKNKNYFTINKFKFTLKPVDDKKAYGDSDPVVSAEEGFAVTAVPAADMVDAENNALSMPQAVEVVATWDKPVKRATGEFVAVYDITITNAALKTQPLLDGSPLSAPFNNYEMTVEKGAFEIINAPYFVSSKFVTREFKSGSMVVPDNGFYLYRRVVPTEGEPYYAEIPETDDVYQEIKGRISGNELAQNYTQLQPVGSPFRIQPIVANEGYDYPIGILDPRFYQHVDGDYAQTPEGQLVVTKRKIAIVAEDKTTAFGEEYAELTYKVYAGTEANADKILDGTKDVDGDGENDNFTINTNNQYAANTIVRFGGLASEIATAVNDAQKPLTDKVTADIVAQNQQTTINANPNYDITFVKGTYTVTPSGKTVFVNLAVTKNYGEGHVAVTDADKRVVTVKLGATKETAEDFEWLGIGQNLDYRFIQGELQQDEPTEVGTYGKDKNFKVVNATENSLPTVINGYPVDYDGSLTINTAGAVVIAVKTLVYNYPVEPQLSFDANRVKVTGAATFEQIAANNPVLTYEKPQVGFIKKGAEVKVQCGEKAYGTAAGEVVDPETAGADWAWVKNYESVTVKSSALKVTAPEDITIDIVSFQKAKYAADADKSDELIRDYAGTEVNSVTVVASKQDTEAPEADQYEVQGNQWYSMVLPFKSSPRDIQKIFNGFASVDILSKTATANKASEIRFALTVDSIPANEPFVAKTDLDFIFKSEIINATADKKILIEYPENEDGTPGALAVADASGNQFIGTYKAFFAPDKDNYDMINLSHGKVQAMNKDAYVRPLGAYIKVGEGVDNASAPVRVIFEEADGTLTTIDGVEVEDAESAAEFAEGWYTVTGVKLTAEPTVSGTYIYNGKKVYFQAK